MSSIWWERLWPWLGAALIGCVWLWNGRSFPENPDGLFAAAAAVAAVLASFLGVAQAIILTLKGTATFQALDKHGYIPALFGYLRTGIFASVLFAALSLLGFFISRSAVIFGQNAFDLFCFAWVAVAALSFFAYVRISNILFKLLKQP